MKQNKKYKYIMIGYLNFSFKDILNELLSIINIDSIIEYLIISYISKNTFVLIYQKKRKK